MSVLNVKSLTFDSYKMITSMGKILKNIKIFYINSSSKIVWYFGSYLVI